MTQPVETISGAPLRHCGPNRKALSYHRWSVIPCGFEAHVPNRFLGFLLLLLLTAYSLSAATPKRRPNVLRLASTVAPSTLDAAPMGAGTDLMLFPLLHLPLLDLTNGISLTPCAAQAWSASPDQRIFTLRLRPEIRFSNGREVVAQDYVYAFKRILEPATGAGMSQYLMGIRGAKAFVAAAATGQRGTTNDLAGLRAPAPDTLIIELEHSDPTFPYVLSTFTGTAAPREEVERLGAAFRMNPVGTGPYVVDEWRDGTRLKLKRNPHYHGPEPVHFDGIDLLVGSDETTHLMMFERGELDFLEKTPAPSLRRLSNDPRWRDAMVRETLMFSSWIALNVEIPPLDNVLVRRAINHAMDRDRRMRVGLGVAAHAEGILPPGMPGYDPAFRGYDYNPDKACALLRESGLTLPLHTQLWHVPDERETPLALGFQFDLAQVGIEVELKPISFNALVLVTQTRGRVPMFFTGWGSVIPDPVEILGLAFDGRTATEAFTWNFSRYNNPEVVELLDHAAAALEKPKRFDLYRQAQERIVRDAPGAFLGHPNLCALRQPWLKGPLLELLWAYRLDRVWFEW